MEERLPRLLRERGFEGTLAELSEMPLEPVRLLHCERLPEEEAVSDADASAAIAWARTEVTEKNEKERVTRADDRRFGRR